MDNDLPKRGASRKSMSQFKNGSPNSNTAPRRTKSQTSLGQASPMRSIKNLTNSPSSNAQKSPSKRGRKSLKNLFEMEEDKENKPKEEIKSPRMFNIFY